jgi:hypothetical protein
MKRAIGLTLAFAGGAVAAACILLALAELGGLYAGAINDPLGQPESAEGDVSRRMLTFAAAGAAGAVPAMVGVFLWRTGKRR